VLYLSLQCPIRTYFFLCFDSASGLRCPHCWGFDVTLRHVTLSRNPLDEWSSRRRDLYLKTRNTYKTYTHTHTHTHTRRDSNRLSQVAGRPRPMPWFVDHRDRHPKMIILSLYPPITSSSLALCEAYLIAYLYVFLTVHLGIILDNDQLDTDLPYFTTRLLQSFTCFEHYMLIIRSLNCMDAASGIVTLSKWLSGI
jgi:hypothetical protein